MNCAQKLKLLDNKQLDLFINKKWCFAIND